MDNRVPTVFKTASEMRVAPRIFNGGTRGGRRGAGNWFFCDIKY